jgi:hypothetical protein
MTRRRSLITFHSRRKQRRSSSIRPLDGIVLLISAAFTLMGMLLHGLLSLIHALTRSSLRPSSSKKGTNNSAQTWREAAAKSSQGRHIYDLLQREMAGPTGDSVHRLLVESCAQSPLTRSLPERVITYIHLESLKGRRAEGIAEDVQSMLPEIPQEQLRSITRTVISKASTAISALRARRMNLPCYEWLTSEDIRVRPAHRKMNHVIVFWNDPPSPEALIGGDSTDTYHAGESEGCRCDANVIVDLAQIPWPAKVYSRGSITRMSKAKFVKLSGYER